MCDKPCADCNEPCSTNGNGSNGVIDIEDYQRQLTELQQKTKDLELKIANAKRQKPLRSGQWLNRADNIGMTGLYMDRYLNYGLTRAELLSGKPIIGIAQSGSDLAPCNRYHIELAKRVREGIRTAGGICIEFPTHPIQESARRPTATLDRNFMYLGLVELLHAYPFDGVVLLTGCDKTTPAALMAAATIDIPAICLNVGPMLNGWQNGELMGSGVVLWKAREKHAAGLIDDMGLIDMVTKGTPSVGHCNTMGTASTMNALAEALGMALPGSAAIPAPYKERAMVAYETGEQIVEMVKSDRKPSDILTRQAFENAIVVNTAIGGSTNAPIHLNAVARHVGVKLDLDDWDGLGYGVPLLVNMQPAGEMLGEDYYRAGGLPAVMAELWDQGKLHEIMTCTGKTVKDNVAGKHSWDRQTIKEYGKPMKTNAGFAHMKGTLFDSAIMKTSVISPEFRKEFLEDPNDPMAFECKAIVFDGPEDYHERIAKPETGVDKRTILVMRGAGPIGYPGAAEVVNMTAPGHLIKQGVSSLPCIGDGRQSGTSGSPSILNASPEAADGGNLAILKDGDKLRVDLNKRRVDILVSEEELKQRRKELEKKGGFPIPPSQTPWQDIFRRETGQLSEGMVLKNAVQFQRVAQKWPAPRDNH
jgi:dihydroxy-acid dehydratase